MGLAHCIDCGCHDLAACVDETTGGPCGWLAVDRAASRGVCSACPEALVRWDNGDRAFAVPVEPHDEAVAPTQAARLSEPQRSLLNKLGSGATLVHEARTWGRSRFRLTEAGRSRTIHPATVTSLVRAGVLVKDTVGHVRLAAGQ